MKSKDVDLEDHLGYWLRFVSNHVSGTFREKIQGFDVTVAEWVVLRTLYKRSACTLNHLSEDIGVDAGAISRLVDKMIKKKLVTRKTGANDRRSVAIELTENGNSLVPKIANIADKNDSHFFSGLPKADQDHLRRIMKNLVNTHNLKSKPTQ